MNKVLIIGGTSGIGRGLVDVYLKNGYKVGVVGRRTELLNQIKSTNQDVFIETLDVSNISKSNDEYSSIVNQFAKENLSESLRLCGNIEMEISNLNIDEQEDFLSIYNLDSSGLDQLILSCYSLLGLETFFTAGVQEIKAWTIKKGSTAPEAAGVIHTDFQRGFIKADTFNFSDILKVKSEKKLKELGLIRQEGKSYIVKDGDCIFFRFNV